MSEQEHEQFVADLTARRKELGEQLLEAQFELRKTEIAFHAAEREVERLRALYAEADDMLDQINRVKLAAWSGRNLPAPPPDDLPPASGIH